jgi:hypothetical protein
MRNVILFFVVILCVFSISTIQGQTRFGLKGGLNIAYGSWQGPNTSVREENRKLLYGYHLEGLCVLPVKDRFAFRLGIGVHLKGDKYSETVSGRTTSLTTAPIYIQLPVIASYVNEKFHIGAGPYFGFAVAGNITSKATGGGLDDKSNSKKIVFGNALDNNIRPLDVGLQLEAGFTINYDYIISASYNVGLGNIVPTEYSEEYGITGRFNSISISVGYLFPY